MGISQTSSRNGMSADIVSYLREADMRYHMCRQRDFRHVCHLKTGGAYV